MKPIHMLSVSTKFRSGPGKCRLQLSERFYLRTRLLDSILGLEL